MKEEVQKAIEELKKGNVILYPAETVWGIGCDASNSEAVKKIFSIKQRDSAKALIILISDLNQLSMYVHDVPEIAWDIMEFSEKPLTVILPGAKNVAPELLADDGTIAVRWVKEGFIHNLIHRFGRAITSTSANISGEQSPLDFQSINKEIIQRCDYVVPELYAQKLTGKPSQIVKIGQGGEFKIIRK